MKEMIDGILDAAIKQVEAKFPDGGVKVSSESFRGSPAQTIVEKAEK